jgi:tetratricopeptide (TPR) repeat protein
MLAPGPGGDAPRVEVAAPAAGSPGTEVCAGTSRAARLRTALYRRLRRPGFWVAVLFLGLVAAAVVLAIPHARAWHHRRAARAELERYHNPQAIRHLQSCLAVWPDDPEALLLAARAARRARAYPDADVCLEKYQRTRGCDAAASFEQLLLTAERNVDQVAPLCRRHVEEKHRDAPLILEALTRGYLRQYRLPEARFCLDRWLKRQPDNPQALCLQGELQLDYERASDRALASYRRAVQLDPEHEDARQGLAIALLETKNFAAAARHLEHLSRCQPENLRLRVGLAECRHGLGEGAEAVRLVDRVLAEAPRYAPALTLRGRLALDAQQFAAAETWLRRAVALAPGNHQARYSLMVCLHRNGKDEEARRQKQKLKEMEEGVKRFNEIVTRDMIQRPHDAALHYTLGRLLLRSGHQPEGLRWLQSALRLDPQYAPARKALAEYYQKAKLKR